MLINYKRLYIFKLSDSFHWTLASYSLSYKSILVSLWNKLMEQCNLKYILLYNFINVVFIVKQWTTRNRFPLTWQRFPRIFLDAPSNLSNFECTKVSKFGRCSQVSTHLCTRQKDKIVFARLTVFQLQTS